MISSLIIYFSVFLVSSYACYCYELITDNCNRENKTKRLQGLKLRLYRTDVAKFLCVCFILLPPVFLSTFRDLTVGTDTKAYLAYYDNLKTYNVFEYFTLFGFLGMKSEIGYQQIQHIAYLTGGGYNLVKFISSILIIFFVWRGTLYYHEKFQINTGFCMFFFYMLEFASCLNTVRFAIALSIFFYSFQFVIKKEFGKYLLCCFGMVLFHIALSFTLLLYLINYSGYIKLRKYWKYISAILAIVSVFFIQVFVSSIYPFLTEIFVKLQMYSLYTNSEIATVSGLVFRSILLLSPLLYWNKYIRKHIDWTFILLAIMLYIPFRSLAFINRWFSRLSRVPEILLCVLYCGLMKLPFHLSEKLLWKVYVVAVAIFYFIFMVIIRNDGEIIPYIFDFTNHI